MKWRLRVVQRVKSVSSGGPSLPPFLVPLVRQCGRRLGSAHKVAGGVDGCMASAQAGVRLEALCPCSHRMQRLLFQLPFAELEDCGSEGRVQGCYGDMAAWGVSATGGHVLFCQPPGTRSLPAGGACKERRWSSVCCTPLTTLSPSAPGPVALSGGACPEKGWSTFCRAWGPGRGRLPGSRV